jgi:hypothetical protein
MFIAIKSHKTTVVARLFLNAGHKACPIKIRTLLADNGKESLASSPAPAFVALALPAPATTPGADIRIEIKRGTINVNVV